MQHLGQEIDVVWFKRDLRFRSVRVEATRILRVHVAPSPLD